MLNGRMDGYWIGGYLRPDQFLDHMTVSVRQANKIHKIVKSLIKLGIVGSMLKTIVFVEYSFGCVL